MPRAEGMAQSVQYLSSDPGTDKKKKPDLAISVKITNAQVPFRNSTSLFWVTFRSLPIFAIIVRVQ
jgi:hypothetical protein